MNSDQEDMLKCCIPTGCCMIILIVWFCFGLYTDPTFIEVKHLERQVAVMQTQLNILQDLLNSARPLSIHGGGY